MRTHPQLDPLDHALRRGATVVEVALVAPVAFLLIIGLFVGGMATFRYQQVAHLAREGSRWASLYGPKYQSRTGRDLPTSDDVLVNAVRPAAVSLKPADLTCDLQRSANRRLVTVTVRYTWKPPAMLPEIVFRSTSVSPVCN